VKNYIPFDDWLTLSEEMQRLARPHAQGVLKVISPAALGEGDTAARLRVAHPHSQRFAFRRIMRAGGRRALP
jgi:hypothetical protein